MERTYYKLIPMTGKEQSLENHLDLARKLRTLRESNRGYFVYEITETPDSRSMKFLCGWNPRV